MRCYHCEESLNPPSPWSGYWAREWTPPAPWGSCCRPRCASISNPRTWICWWRHQGCRWFLPAKLYLLIFSCKSFRNDELLFASNWIGLCNKYFLFETFLKVVFKMKYKASWQCNIHCLFSQFVKHYSILNSKICTEERNSKNAFLISKYINSIKWKPVENNCYYLYVEKCFFYFMDID